jgi:hypothetical protein
MEINNLPILGKTMRRAWRGEYWGNDALYFEQDDGEVFVLTHLQDCCEWVYIESVDGDLEDLVGAPLLMAEEAIDTNESNYGSDASMTYTFYKLATTKGYVTIRFYGGSNGYYSERVDWFYLSEE